MVGESASLFLSMFWKMSSALKDCQQVFEAGTLESDRKRAFGLFFSPRNPAPLANPWQLRFYFFTSLWERRNKTRRGRGCWCLPLAWAHGLGREQGAAEPPCLFCCSRSWGHQPFQPQAARDPFPRSPEPVVGVTAHLAFSHNTRRKEFSLTEILCEAWQTGPWENRVIRHFIWGRHASSEMSGCSEIWSLLRVSCFPKARTWVC